MGWGRMMLLGNVGQQLDIQDLENAIREMQAELQQSQQSEGSQERSLSQLQFENHQLKLYVTTLVRLLAGKGIITQEEIDAAVRAIDRTGP